MSSLDPRLPSWRHGPRRDAILQFIDSVTDSHSPSFVPEAERIATFDHDGTLWVEKPHVTEITFIKDLMQHDETRLKPRCGTFVGFVRHYLALLMDKVLSDARWLLREWLEGVSTDEYKIWVLQWLGKATHPRFHRPYPQLVYQPMLEVLALFRQHGFRNYLVSGGSCYFIRAFSEQAYGIDPEQALGSQLMTRVAEKDGKLVVELKPVPWFFDNGKGKVLCIESHIDRHPIAAFGNSSGDIAMLRWAGQSKTSLCMLVHHTDDVREYAYSPGQKTLDAVQKYQWQLIDMKEDWLTVFAEPAPVSAPVSTQAPETV